MWLYLSDIPRSSRGSHLSADMVQRLRARGRSEERGGDCHEQTRVWFHDASGLRFGCGEMHGTADNPALCTATTSMLSEPVTSPVDAGAVTVNASSIRGSRLSASIFVGMNPTVCSAATHTG